METRYPINEIFYSIQGEGCHTGRPAVFIRLAGCNLQCPWCDTDHSEKRKMTGEEIAVCVKSYIPQRLRKEFQHVFVVITGGEPTIHNLEELTLQLKSIFFEGTAPKKGRPKTRHLKHVSHQVYIAVETNGYRLHDLICLKEEKLIDWITVSPKERPQNGEWREEHYKKSGEWIYTPYDLLDEIKVVLDETCDIEYFRAYGLTHAKLGRAFVQPCSENFQPAIDFVLENPRWRLSIQIQKIVDMR